MLPLQIFMLAFHKIHQQEHFSILAIKSPVARILGKAVSDVVWFMICHLWVGKKWLICHPVTGWLGGICEPPAVCRGVLPCQFFGVCRESNFSELPFY